MRELCGRCLECGKELIEHQQNNHAAHAPDECAEPVSRQEDVVHPGHKEQIVRTSMVVLDHGADAPNQDKKSEVDRCEDMIDGIVNQKDEDDRRDRLEKKDGAHKVPHMFQVALLVLTDMLVEPQVERIVDDLNKPDNADHHPGYKSVN